MDIIKKKNAVALLSVISNSFLVIVKLLTGLFIGSVSVISEAVHSGVDVIAASFALYGVRQSGQPADNVHAFGHGKFENLSGLVQALLIFIASGWIVFDSITKLLNPKHIEEPGVGVLIMLVSSVVNALVAKSLFKVAKESDSVALKADAWHSLTDVYTSIGVMAGLAIILTGQYLFPHLELDWVDPVAAIIVAIFIFKAAWDLSIESMHDLLDASLPQKEQEQIIAILKENYPRVIGYHNLKTRKSGAIRFIEFHLIVNPSMSVSESHSLHHTIEKEILCLFPKCQIMMHIEPCDNRCKESCLFKCFKINRAPANASELTSA